MKKLIPLLIIICLLLPSCQINNEDFYYSSPTSSVRSEIDKPGINLKGVWISCYDHISAEEKSKEEYEAETDEMFKNIKECGLNTAFVHLRAFSDAFYESEIYPYSKYIAGTEGAQLEFDPFYVLLESAEKYNISVHGWINPFRVSTQNDPSLLSDNNPAKDIIDSGNKNNRICILDNGIYYNPSSTENHELIISGVKEILEKYNIDGIHIDDYFYPSTQKGIDSVQFSDYIKQGGRLSLEEWRTANVNAFVGTLCSTVKSFNNSLIVSISPSGKIEDNYNKYYADCKLWLSQKGYADIIIPQIYFGFEHESLPFDSLLNKWSNLTLHSEVKLVCGIGAYKYGKPDEYAGSGNNEWAENRNIISKQLNCVAENNKYEGYVIFSYSDILNDNIKSQLINHNV